MLFFVTDGSTGKIIQCSRKNIYHMTSLHTLWNGVEKMIVLMYLDQHYLIIDLLFIYYYLLIYFLIDNGCVFYNINI